ncbi:phosphopantetheine-binding protein [Streptomyces sp. NPDC001553]|uniref:acyl carrier protein n=1 Tax=Streptomyces sp. NPDC001553 TaxID=3154385 RepID=UPI0033345233
MNKDLRDILVNNLQLDPDCLGPEARLEDAGVDSLAIVELNMLLAEQHGPEIGEDRLASVTTIGALAQLVEDHYNAGGLR